MPSMPGCIRKCRRPSFCRTRLAIRRQANIIYATSAFSAALRLRSRACSRSSSRASQEGIAEFGYEDRVIVRLFRGLRDLLVDKFGLEQAQSALPDYSLDDLDAAAIADSLQDQPQPLPAFSDPQTQEDDLSLIEQQKALDTQAAALGGAIRCACSAGSQTQEGRDCRFRRRLVRCRQTAASAESLGCRDSFATGRREQGCRLCRRRRKPRQDRRGFVPAVLGRPAETGGIQPRHDGRTQ